MEIKTIVYPRDGGPVAFDKQVNEALGQGFKLAHRAMLPGVQVGSTTYQPAYYAELVKPEEPEEPETGDDVAEAIRALRALREFCIRQPLCNDCILENFCPRHMAHNEGPADWSDIPGDPV